MLFRIGRQQKLARGFMLIELMVSVTIVGIVMALAIPAYIDYLNRTRVAEALRILDGLRTDATSFYHQHGHFPTSLADMGHSPTDSTKYVASIDLVPLPAGSSQPDAVELIARLRTDGFVNIGANANGLMLQAKALTPNSPTVQWVCKPADTDPVDTIYLPYSCRG